MSAAPPDGWGTDDGDGRRPRADGSGRAERWHYVCRDCPGCEGLAPSADEALVSGDEHRRKNPEHRVAIEEVENA